MNFTYLVYESDSQQVIPPQLIATFSSQLKADKFITVKQKSSTWEVYTVELMEMDVGDSDVIFQDDEYINIVESFDLSDKEYNEIIENLIEVKYV